MGLVHKDADLRRLVSNQDKYNIHKILGALSVSSFIYRYGFVYPSEGNLGINGSLFDWFTMIIHTLLSCSAIFFYVPKKRIQDKPLIVYEEYRQHAMIFTMRCFFVFVISILYPNSSFYVIPSIVGLHHYQADRITQKHGSPGNTAVRTTVEKLDSSIFYKSISKFYSLYQFLALGSHLSYNSRKPDLAYNALIAIQSSVFMMTLYKKKIICGKTHIIVYSSCLLISIFHILKLLELYTVVLIVLAFIVRIKTSISKYIIWPGFLFLDSVMKMTY